MEKKSISQAEIRILCRGMTIVHLLDDSRKLLKTTSDAPVVRALDETLMVAMIDVAALCLGDESSSWDQTSRFLSDAGVVEGIPQEFFDNMTEWEKLDS